jgi:hypothetical protein
MNRVLRACMLILTIYFIKLLHILEYFHSYFELIARFGLDPEGFLESLFDLENSIYSCRNWRTTIILQIALVTFSEENCEDWIWT